MLINGIVSEALLYLFFSILLGSFILQTVPISYRPGIVVRKRVLMLSLLGILILTFIPVLQLILIFYKDIGLALTIKSVLFTFEVGKAGIFTVILSIILLVYIAIVDLKRKVSYSLVGILFTIVLIITLGWASHAASLTEWTGFITHSFHFLAVSTWIGILLIVSWFSTNKGNWLNFLTWFTPVAIICLDVKVVEVESFGNPNLHYINQRLV